jgi:hypothetical protein
MEIDGSFFCFVAHEIHKLNIVDGIFPRHSPSPRPMVIRNGFISSNFQFSLALEKKIKISSFVGTEIAEICSAAFAYDET